LLAKTGTELFLTGKMTPLVLGRRIFANTARQMIRLTIRATDESVPPVLLKIVEERLAVGFSSAPVVDEGPTKREISDAFSNVMVD
jgi:AP-2 complex subunit alpha